MSLFSPGALFTPFSSALSRTGFTALFPTTTSALLAALIGLVNGGPGAALRFFLTGAALLVAFFNVFCFAFLLARIFGFASSCHYYPLWFILFLKRISR